MKKTLRKLLLVFMGLIALSLGIYLYFVFSVTHYEPLPRTPKDAIFVLHTKNGAKAWRKISESMFWQHLQKQPYFRELTEGTEVVGKAFSEYQRVADWVFAGREITLSAHPHPTKPEADYEFLILADLGNSSALSGGIENLSAYLGGYEVTPSENFRNVQLYRVFDRAEPEADALLSFAVLNNLLVVSPNDSLIRKTIRGEPMREHFMENTYFQLAEEELPRSLGDLYIQYEYLDEFAGYFLDEANPAITDLSQSVQFSALGLDIDQEQEREILTLQGATTIRDTLSSYLRAALISGQSDIRAPRILSQSTAFYFSLTFDDFLTFYDNFDAFLQEDEAAYQEYEGNIRRLEKFLDINLREDLMSWMSDEIAVVNIDRQDLTPKDRFALCIRTNDVNFAKERLAFISDQVRKKTPVRFKTFDYNGHLISFLSIKGFFKLFLGNYFSKIEKPYFTIVEDYVIFSNSPQTLKTIIDDYQAKLTLASDPSFQEFFSRFSTNATFFAYTNTGLLPNMMRGFLDRENYTAMRLNRDFIVCFSQLGMQMKPDGVYFDTQLISRFESPSNVRKRQSELENARAAYLRDGNKRGIDRLRSFFDESSGQPGELPEGIAVSERELISTDRVKQLNVQGKMETGYYENGNKKYRVRVRGDQRDGLYKEFHEDGSLKVRGRYKDGLREGVWKYYNRRGTVIDTEHYLRGKEELF